MSAPTPLFPSAGPKIQQAYKQSDVATAQARFDACLQQHEDGITTHKGSVKKNTHKCVTPTAAELAHFRHVLTTGTGAADANEKHRIKKDLRLDPADPSTVQWRNGAERGLKGAAADGHATIVCRDYWGDRLLVAHINPATGAHLGRDATYGRAEWPQGQPQAGLPEDTLPKVRPPMKEVVQAWIESCPDCHRGGKASTKRKRPADNDGDDDSEAAAAANITTTTTTTAPRPKKAKSTTAALRELLVRELGAPPSSPLPAPLQPGADLRQLPEYREDHEVLLAAIPQATNNNNVVAAAPLPPSTGFFAEGAIDPRLLQGDDDFNFVVPGTNEEEADEWANPQPVLPAAPADARLEWALAHRYYRVQDAVQDFRFPIDLLTAEEVDAFLGAPLPLPEMQQQEKEQEQEQEQVQPQQAAEEEEEAPMVRRDEWKEWLNEEAFA